MCALLHRPSQPEPGEGAPVWRPLRPLNLPVDGYGVHVFSKEQATLIVAHIIDETDHKRPLRRADKACTGGAFKGVKGRGQPKTPTKKVFRCLKYDAGDLHQPLPGS